MIHRGRTVSIAMPRRILAPALLALVALTALALGTRSVHADPRDFTLYNYSRDTVIVRAYVSPANEGRWGEDVLGDSVLYPGDSVDIAFWRFDPYYSTCYFDIRVEGLFGEEGELYGINLCSTSTVTFR
jgi:hypothetical protein